MDMFHPKYAMINFISPSVHLEVHTWRLALDKMRLARARGLRSCADASKRNKTARILKEGFKLSNKLAIKLYVCIYMIYIYINVRLIDDMIDDASLMMICYHFKVLYGDAIGRY